MATPVIFLSEQTLKNESILQDNVDMKVVTPTIRDVQSFYILPILGTSLYEQLQDGVRNSTLTNLQKGLLDDYIIPVMVWYTRMELPMNMNYKYFNKSVGVQNADNMNPANMDEVLMIMDRAKNKAEWYAQRLTNYLAQNQTSFPLYNNQTNVGIDTIFPNRNNYTSGLVLGSGGCCRGQYNFRGIPSSPLMARQPCNDCD
jgi:hypothetical protein